MTAAYLSILRDRRPVNSNTKEGDTMMPLNWLRPDTTGYVKCIRGHDGTCRHLRSLGLTEGEPVRLTHRNGKNVIIAVRGCRLALDESLALRIFVSEESPEEELCSCPACPMSSGNSPDRTKSR